MPQPLPPPFKSALFILAVFLLAACAGRGQQTSTGARVVAEETRAVASVNSGRRLYMDARKPGRRRDEGRRLGQRARNPHAPLRSVPAKRARGELGIDEGTDEGRRRLALLREGVVSELIDRELIRREAERRGLRPAPEIRRRLLTQREAAALGAWLEEARRAARIRVAEPYRVGALRDRYPPM